MKSQLQLLPLLLLLAFAPGCAEEAGQSTDSPSAEEDSSSSTDEGGEEDSSSSEEGGNEEGGNEEDATTIEGDTEELDDGSAGEEGGGDVEEADAGDTEEADAEGDTEQQPETEEVVDCGNPPSSVEACDVIPGSDVFVLHGTVLGPEATYLGGEVVIAKG